MKPIKKITIMLVMFAVTFLSIGEVSAAGAPASLQMAGTSSNLKYLGMHFPIKYAKDGRVLYCLNFHSTSPKYKTLKKIKANDAGITKIIENGYGHKKITGDKSKDYYITSMAIHLYIDRKNGVSDSKNGNMSASAKKNIKNSAEKGGMGEDILRLVNLAMKASYDKPKMTVNSAANTLSLTSDKKYYTTGNISVSGTSSVEKAYQISVSGISGAELVDTNGNKKTSFKLNETFRVRIPAANVKVGSSKLSLAVSGKSTIMKTYRYSTKSSKYQDLTPPTLYPETKTVKASKELTVSKTNVKFTKTDITGERELDGAHLVVKDSKGSVIDRWQSKRGVAHYIEGLQNGSTYTLEETIAPPGYYLSQAVPFTVLNNQVTTVTMKDEITKVIISKQDATSKTELEGAHLVVRDSKGNVIEEWDSTNEPHYIEGLLLGEKYTLEETIAPDGYILNQEKIEFEIDASGVTTNVVMYNELKPKPEPEQPKPEEVKVPETASNVPLSVSIIGFGSVLLGSGVIYRRVKQH